MEHCRARARVRQKTHFLTILQAEGVEDVQHVGLLASGRSGPQIASALNARDNITTLHLISHGSADQIVLGNQSLDTASLEDFRSELATIGSHLSASADIIRYSRLMSWAVASNSPTGGRRTIHDESPSVTR